jgi:hypothetical protein
MLIFYFRIQIFVLIDNLLVLHDRLASYLAELIFHLIILNNWFLMRLSVGLNHRLMMPFCIGIIDLLLVNIIFLSCLEPHLQSYKIWNVLQIINLLMILIIYILLENLLRLTVIDNVNLVSHYKGRPLVFVQDFILFYFSIVNDHVPVLGLLKFVFNCSVCSLVLCFNVHYFWGKFFVLKNVLRMFIVILIIIYLLLSNNITLQ